MQDKLTKLPFDSNMTVAYKIQELAFSPPFNMAVYPGTGFVDGNNGDHIMLAPSFFTKKKDVDHIVNVVSSVVNQFFKD